MWSVGRHALEFAASRIVFKVVHGRAVVSIAEATLDVAVHALCMLVRYREPAPEREATPEA